MTESEQWYMVNVAEPKKVMGELIKFGVPCNSVISDSSGTVSITFPSSYKNRVFSHIGKQSDEYILEPTGVENIFSVIFTSNEITIETPPPGEFFEGWADIVPVICGVQKCFGVKIIPSNPHGNPRGPTDSKNENILYVRFWSTPEPSKKIKLKNVFGLPLLDGQPDAFKPNGKWVVIKDEAGTAVAEYVNNNLYILFDLPHSNGEGVTEMFTRIMQAYFKLKGKSESELANFYHHVRGEGLSSKNAFVKSCNKLHEKKLKSMEESIENHNEKINACNKVLVETTREKEILESALEPLKKSVNDRRKIAENEYDILMATPHVKDVVVVGETIHIFTDMIRIKDRNIGEFRIEIHTSGGNSGVKIYNLTRVINIDGISVHHPHIKNDGECCLGNAKEGVIKMLTSYQYVILGQVLLNFLHSYNKESAYLYAEMW